MNNKNVLEKNIKGLNVIAVDEQGKEIQNFTIEIIGKYLYAITGINSTDRKIHTLKVRDE